MDYAIAEEKAQLLTKLKSESIIDIERYFDVVEKFNNFDRELFNEELENLLPEQNLTKDDFNDTINNLMKPKELIRVALDNANEVVAFDEFIEAYRELYEELGAYNIYTIENNDISYKEVLELEFQNILTLSKKIKNKLSPIKIEGDMEGSSSDNGSMHP